jgi:YD repeat-containing protein
MGLLDADSNLTTFAYDGLNRKTGATSPQGCPSTFLYNGAGMLTESIDALSRIVVNQYDTG